MISKEEVGRRIRTFGATHYRSMVDFAHALGMKTNQHLYTYLNGKSYPGFELLDKLRRLGMDIVNLMEEQPSQSEPPRPAPEIDYRSEEERVAVERDVEALIRIAFSYFEYANDAEIDELKLALTRAELARHRRRGGREEVRESLTDMIAGLKLTKKGAQKRKVDIEKLIADAIREAGPPPSKLFQPDWDVRKSATDAVDNFFKSEGQEITDDNRRRLIDALVTMETWRFSRQLGLDKLQREAMDKKSR